MSLINVLLKYLSKANNPKQDIHKNLQSEESLLRKYNLTLEANTVATVINLLGHDNKSTYEKLINEYWWIGKDAVAEVDLAIAGGFTAQVRQDQDTFQKLVIELYQQLEEEGYESKHAQLVTSQYHKWLVSRM